jgi:hypothetical protein
MWNPGNRDVRGIGLAELRALYPSCAIEARRVTLAPPITRVCARVSPAVCRALEAVPWLRSHYMAAVKKPGWMPGRTTYDQRQGRRCYVRVTLTGAS